MSHAPIDAATALSRHPEAVAAILAKTGTKQADELQWSYSMAVRLDGTSRARVVKGWNQFLQNPAAFPIELEGRLGRKRKFVSLDSADLATAPLTAVPMELFQRPKPEGVSSYAWQPRRPESPGWNEHIITEGLRKNDLILLHGISDNGATAFHGFDGHRWRELLSHQATDLMGVTRAALSKWIQRKSTPPAASGIQVLSLDSIEVIVNALRGRRLFAPPVSTQDILQALGSSFPTLADTRGEALELPGKNQGRQFGWEEQLSTEDGADYVALVESTSRPAFGSAVDIFTNLANPVNQAKDDVAARLLRRLALGENRADALAGALTDHAKINGLAPPVPGNDALAYLEEAWDSKPRAELRLYTLGHLPKNT